MWVKFKITLENNNLILESNWLNLDNNNDHLIL